MKKQQTTNSIKIQSKNLEILKKHFPHCFDKNGKFDLEKFKKELSKNEDIDFSNESYGMDWLGKSYARLLASDEATTLLKENKEWNKKDENKNSENLLIKGDNLEVLKHLSNAYYEKIKMIYIDPPYNTGGDGFVYQDDRKFSVEKLSKLAGIDEEKANRILEFTQSKSNSHSAWLTFMYPRLYIAKQLLKDDGVIFVSIDDNEVAQLRIMMDEIFGEENFVGQFKWNRVAKAPSLSESIRTKYEYVICFKKGQISKLFGKKSYNDQGPVWHNPNKQQELLFPKKSILVPKSFSKGSKSEKYQVELLDDIVEENGINKFPVRIKACSAWGQDKIDQYLKKGNLFQIKKDIGTLYSTLPKGENNFIAPSDLISKEECNVQNNTDATTELELLGIPFSNPKPSSLVKYLVNMVTHIEPSSIILDFFAGSGTTGDAVMQLNAEDKGNRKYILVQLPEIIDSKKDKIAYDFVKNELKVDEPTIFEITKERLIRAAKKINEETINKKIKEKESEIKKLQEQLDLKGKKEKIENLKQEIEKLKNQDFGFKIFETIPNDKGNWVNYILDAEKFDPQTELFDESKLTKEDLETLLTTWKTYDGFSLTQNLKEIDLDGYIGYYLDNKLYLVDKGFETNHLRKMLEVIDSKKEFKPAVIIAFGYNFESKILREIADNVKNYANKKQIEIDFIARY